MLWTVSVEHSLTYLYVVGSGPATLPDMCGLADMIATICARTRKRRVLFDLLGAEVFGFTFTEHLTLGAYVAQSLGGLERVATVVIPRNHVGTSERAAQHHGLEVKTFTELQPARTWLSADLQDAREKEGPALAGPNAMGKVRRPDSEERPIRRSSSPNDRERA